MRLWISDLKEGESAFDQADINKIPHKVENGEIVINKRKNGDKSRRQIWDKVGPCIHTRNDQLASQNTIHPTDDRVFSIRELMHMMTIPNTFKWSNIPEEQLNAMSIEQKKAFLKKEEMNIRQCLGEAVPTIIFESIAKKYNPNGFIIPLFPQLASPDYSMASVVSTFGNRNYLGTFAMFVAFVPLAFIFYYKNYY